MSGEPNRLIHETSPYLLQHAHNPVDWYPWGDEALTRAREDDKPILLSIGYAACHWCHVMERESFEDAETARLMNEGFVCIKVDREERPDLDAVYMSAVQAMSGHGGWPMTVFLTPDGHPFYGGTYFPPEPRHGMPSFRQVLAAVADAWTRRRAEVLDQSVKLTEYIAGSARLTATADPLNESLLDGAVRAAAGSFDAQWGGFGGPPKFPQVPTLDLLLRLHRRGAAEALAMLSTTLDRMARGGIYDHVAGGFARYAVDAEWHVPHFEKMLYDNAQLLRVYTRAWLETGRPLYRRVAEETGEYLLREMQHPAGGFFSSQDADSEGVEGKFAVWTHAEILEVAGDDGSIVAAAFDVTPEGNWEGVNVLWRPRDDERIASEAGITVADLEAAIGRARRKLFAARSERVPPGTDDKVLAAWNGLAISGLAEAGRALGRPDFVEAAARAADFVTRALRGAGGRLLRSWRDGRAAPVPGFLDDHAMMAEAFLDLYETTFDVRWYRESERLAREILRLFSDPERGGFFDTGSDAPSPVVRPKSLFDNATPAGGSVAADVLLRLSALGADEGFEAAALGTLRMLRAALERAPLGFGTALCALDRSLSGSVEVAVVGDPAGADTRALVDAVRRRPPPNTVLAVGAPGSSEPALLRDRPAVEGRATAYVCRGFVCRRPVTDSTELQAELEAAAAPA